MKSHVSRRSVIAAAPAAGLATLPSGCVTGRVSTEAPDDLYRVDDEAAILAAARRLDFVRDYLRN